MPDVVEVYRLGDSATPPTFLGSVGIDQGKRIPEFIELELPAPTFLILGVSPRTVRDGSLTDQMADDSGDLQYWETFSVQLPPFTLAADGTSAAPKAGRTGKPTIVRVALESGALIIDWTSPKVDRFNVTLVPSLVPFQGQIELAGSDRRFFQPRVPMGRYRFSIQGCTRGLIDFKSNCSEWAVTEILVPAELGFQPWRRWFQIHPETVFDYTKQRIAAVSRSWGNLDLFVIGFDNAVWSSFWNEARGWSGWFQIHPETVFDHTKQQVAAVSRAPGNLDLFVIGFDNVVWTSFWNQTQGWSKGFQIHRETVFDHTTQQVAAVSRAPGNLDLFVIGFDNAVWTTFWNEHHGWNHWFQIHRETVFNRATQQITAVSRGPGNLDLFVIGFDNAVWTTFWNEQHGWNRWFQIHPETVFDHTTQRIAAVSRAPGNLDLFVIGFDNAVWSSFWNEGRGWSNWFQIHPKTVFDRSNQKITAVSRARGNLDLFVVGFDNAVWSTFWNEKAGWGSWFQIHPKTVFDHSEQQIAAISRAPDNLDLFVIGFDNAVWSSFWD